ncbi:MAG: diguanylate cyclase [Porticoccaceae bacterium]|nr:diguanylate cyclase [Porticoccaceae bacterium]
MDILIVEDSATLRASMKAVLLAMGHRVHMAESGEQCLHMIENQPSDQRYSLVIMDVELPGLDGFETTSLLREAMPDEWIPIIFVSGDTDEASVKRGIDADGDDYLAKPVNRVILQAKIKAMERIAEMQHEMSRLYRELEITSKKDSLTQLFNRRAFNEQVEQLWLDARRHQHPCALLMLDIDHFKEFNDAYGHLAGDSCLQAVAACLLQVVDPDCHILARYGGEEFIVFLNNIDRNGVLALSGDILVAVEALGIPHARSPVSHFVTVSVGVSLTLSPENHSLQQLIGAADKLLYRAKNNGRNQVNLEELDSHRTILIAVDVCADQKALIAMLAELGNIITAENSKECLEIARYIIPDLIVIEQALSGGAGRKICKILKQSRNTAHIPIILMVDHSGGGMVSDIELVKPVAPEAIQGAVRQLIF